MARALHFTSGEWRALPAVRPTGRRHSAPAGASSKDIQEMYHGAEEGGVDNLLTYDDGEDEHEVDFSCQVEHSGQNPPDENGQTQVNNRSLDVCTDDLDCAPQVKFRESGNTEEDEYIDGAQVGGHSAWLRVLYPDAAAAAERTANRKDFHWCYFVVWMGHFLNSGEDAPGAQYRWMNLVPPTAAPLSSTQVAVVVVAAGVQHYAVYDHAFTQRADGLRSIHLRYWVGVMLHPSTWTNRDGTLGEQTWGDLPDEVADSVDVRIQTFMSSVLNVRARLVWRPARYCTTRYVRNDRDYPVGGLGLESARVLWRDEEGVFVAEEAYEQTTGDPSDLSWAAYQQTRGNALAVLGNVVRGQVKFVLESSDTRTVAELAVEGFECVFGRRVVSRMDFDYIPGTDPTHDGYRVMVRRCLTAAALEHVDGFVEEAAHRVAHDDSAEHPWARLVYQDWDASSIADDRL